MATRKRAFESIESAHEYLDLLIDSVHKESVSVENVLDSPPAMMSARHRDALRLVDYKMRSLTNHLATSRRLLNDLRTLRRYLLDERAKPTPESDELIQAQQDAITVLHP